MKRYLKQKQAQIAMTAARFIMQKHEHTILKYLATFLAWANRKRYGNEPLDFLEARDSKDEQF